MTAARILSIIIGYLFGLFTTGYFYAKHMHVDIRSMGSGNIGTTNTFRTLGKKAGILVFLGDGFKGVFAVLLVWLLFRERYPDGIKILEAYAGLGAVLGHNFPVQRRQRNCDNGWYDAGILSMGCAGMSAAVCTQYLCQAICFGRFAAGLYRIFHTDRGFWAEWNTGSAFFYPDRNLYCRRHCVRAWTYSPSV